VATVFANAVYPRQGLGVGSSWFRCRHCGKTWERGGHKEGFVKASASRHAFGCWEVGLFLRGYLLGEYRPGGETAIPIRTARNKYPDGTKRAIRGLQAQIRQRRKAGLLAALTPVKTKPVSAAPQQRRTSRKRAGAGLARSAKR
jgi:hypothetical protein